MALCKPADAHRVSRVTSYCSARQIDLCEGWHLVSVARLMPRWIFYMSDSEAIFACQMANNVMPSLEDDADSPSVTPVPRHHVRCHPSTPLPPCITLDAPFLKNCHACIRGSGIKTNQASTKLAAGATALALRRSIRVLVRRTPAWWTTIQSRMRSSIFDLPMPPG